MATYILYGKAHYEDGRIKDICVCKHSYESSFISADSPEEALEKGLTNLMESYQKDYYKTHEYNPTKVEVGVRHNGGYVRIKDFYVKEITK